MNLPYSIRFVFLFTAALIAVAHLAPAASAQNSGVSLTVSTRHDRIYKLSGIFDVEGVIENTSAKPVQITGVPMVVLRSTASRDKDAETVLATRIYMSEKLGKEGWLAAGARDDLFVEIMSRRWTDFSGPTPQSVMLLDTLKYSSYSLTVEIWDSDKAIPRAGNAVIASAPVTINYLEEKKVDWSGISITLVVSGEELKPGSPFSVTAIIENKGDRPFPLRSMPGFILTGGPIVRDGVTYPPDRFMSSPEREKNPAYFAKDVLARGEKIEISADLTALGWCPGNASIIVDEDLFSLISKETYKLTVEIFEPKDRNDGPSTQILRSAPVQVIYK